MKKSSTKILSLILSAILLLSAGSVTAFADGYYSDWETDDTDICEHNYISKDVTEYIVTLECEHCQDIKTGTIPQYVNLYKVLNFSDYGMSYTSLSTNFTPGDDVTVYISTGYADFEEIEFITTADDILGITKAENTYYNCYSFSFSKEGVATVAVVSKYDHSVIYDIITFVSIGYDSYLNTYINYTGETDKAGDVDGNGSITAADARLVLRLSAALSDCNLVTKQYADANGDGTISASDARLVLRVSAEIESDALLADFYVIDTENSYSGYSSYSKTISLTAGKTYSTDDYIMRGRDNIVCSSSNTSVATVDSSNRIKAVKNGYAYITLTNGTETFNYELYVLAAGDSIDNYIYGSQKKSLGIGETYKFEYLVLKDTKNVTWTSSNPSVATVDKNGKIKGVSKGYACIIASNGEESCYYDVNVKNQLQQKIDKLRNKYPDGYYWNNHTPSTEYPYVSEQPCTDHSTKKYAYCKGQCAGFAELMYSEIYGSKAKKNYGVSWDSVEIGDYLRLNPHHSVFVTDVVKKGDIVGYDKWSGENITAYEDYIVVVHCNWGSCCNIAWDDIFYAGSYTINSSLSYSAQ
ncbi:MAG: Ig-like domain-containing protein [Clostridia bacterium]|nr:Ig-like domain-containing protein [Clostridia bacterium]